MHPMSSLPPEGVVPPNFQVSDLLLLAYHLPDGRQNNALSFREGASEGGKKGSRVKGKRTESRSTVKNIKLELLGVVGKLYKTGKYKHKTPDTLFSQETSD